jgi:O-antigen ligase
MKSLKIKNSIYIQKDLYENCRSKGNLNIVINSILFAFFFAVFFLYQLAFLPDNMVFDIIVNSLVLIIFIVSVFNIKIGLYVYIFFIPLINFLFAFFDFKAIPVILFLFFPLFLGLIVNKASYRNKKNELSEIQPLYFDKLLKIPVILFVILIVISLLLTVLRYTNLWPFFTNNYYNLKVNIYGGFSTEAIATVLSNFFNYLVGLGIFFAAINALKKIDDVLNAIFILVGSTALSSVVAIFQKFLYPSFGNYEPWISSGRINSTFTDPNSLGSYAVMLFPIIFILIFYFKKWYLKLITVIILILFLVMTFFSGSRSALIGIFIAFVFFLVIGISKLTNYLKKSAKRKKIIVQSIIYLLLLIIILGSVFIGFTQNKVKQYIQSNGITARTFESIKTAITYTKKVGLFEGIKSISNKRNFFWVRAYQMGRDYPMSGIGVGAFTIELPDYNWKYDKGFAQIDYAGNYYLQLFSEIGFPGLILILIIFSIIIHRFNFYRKLNRKSLPGDKDFAICLGLFISFLTMAIILLFGSHLNNMEIQITLWLVIGLLISYIRLKTGGNTTPDYVSLKVLSGKNKNDNVSRFVKSFCFAAIILIFTFSGIISLFGRTSIFIKQDYFNWPGVWGANTAGLYLPEGYGKDSPRYTEADMTICLEKKASKISFALKAQNPDLNEDPLYVKIYFDYNLITTLKLTDKNWHQYKIKIPDNKMKSFTLTIVNSRTFVPKDWGINDDSRKLGVLLFGNLEFTE